MSITFLLAAGTTFVGILAVLFSWAGVKSLRADRDRIREANRAVEEAGKRFEAARQANQKPISPKQRNNFEDQP